MGRQAGQGEVAGEMSRSGFSPTIRAKSRAEARPTSLSRTFLLLAFGLFEFLHQVGGRQVAADVLAAAREDRRRAAHTEVLAELELLADRRRAAAVRLHDLTELRLRDRSLAVLRAPHRFHLAPV